MTNPMGKSVGEILHTTREERGLTLEQACAVTRVRTTYLKALEAGEEDTLPSKVQARGYLRLYADYLGLPAQPLLDAWPDREPVFVSETTELEVPQAEIEPEELADVSNAPAVAEPSPAESMALPEGLSTPAPETVLEAEVEPSASRSIFIQIGEELQQRRESISLSLEDVERFTRLRSHYITALEQGRVEDLPSIVQGRGMLANYAEFLDLDVDQLLTRFADALQARRLEMLAPEDQTQRAVKTSRGTAVKKTTVRAPGWRRFLTPDLLIGGTFFILFFLLIVWGAARVNDLNTTDEVPTPPSISEVLMNTGVVSAEASQESTAAPTDTPQAPISEVAQVTATPETSNQTSTPPVMAASPLQVYVVASHRAWMQVTVDGSVVFQGRTIPGNAYPYTGREKIELVTGDGSALQVVFNQQDLGELGKIGEVVRLIFTKDGILTPTPLFTSTPSLTPKPSATRQPTAAPATPTITPLIP